jgi:hypothetical protein
VVREAIIIIRDLKILRCEEKLKKHQLYFQIRFEGRKETPKKHQQYLQIRFEGRKDFRSN